MKVLQRDGASIGYDVEGDGAAILVPSCNVPWFGTPFVAALARDFTVVVVSPRGYGPSSRPGVYSADRLRGDLLAVADVAGVDRFAVVGYSLTGAMAAWLALVSDRVDAVVAAGFPIVGDYGTVLADVEQQVPTIADDDFDPMAALAFYRALAVLPANALVDGVRCPLLTFFGGDDEVLEMFVGIAALEAGLRDGGVELTVLDGLDHLGGLVAMEEMVPRITSWLGAVTSPT